jgi:hypothetical protein
LNEPSSAWPTLFRINECEFGCGDRRRLPIRIAFPDKDESADFGMTIMSLFA